METFFAAITLLLFVLAVLAMVVIVRDVLPSLDEDDRSSIRTYWFGSGSRGVWRSRERAIRNAWNEHARLFPKSRKRVLFAALLIAAALSVMGYPLWLAIGVH